MPAAQPQAFWWFCEIRLNFSLPHLCPKETERITWLTFPKLSVDPLQNITEVTVIVMLF